MSSLRVIYVAAAPLGTPAPIRVQAEWSAILAAAERSGRAVTLDALNPATLAQLYLRRRAGGTPPVLHISAHGDVAAGLQLEGENGRAAWAPPATLAAALAAAEPQLVVLSGCATEPMIGDLLAAGVKATVIGCDGFLSDPVAVAYAEHFYQHLFGTGDIAASHMRAVSTMGEKAEGIFHLAQPRSLSGLTTGNRTTTSAFIHAQQRCAAAERLVGRDEQLLRVHAAISTRKERITWVTGPPKSGVSALLRAIADRFSWCFGPEPCVIDLRQVSPDDVLRAVGDMLETGDVELATALERSATLLMFDHLDVLEPEEASRLVTSLNDLSPDSTSHVVIGSSPAVARVAAHQRLALEPLSIPEALHLLARDHSDVSPEARQRLANDMMRWPGRLLLAAEDVRNGTPINDVIAGFAAGDIRLGDAPAVRRLATEPFAAAVLQCLFELGGEAPRGVLFTATCAALSTSAGPPEDHGQFNEAIRRLSDASAIRVAPTGRIEPSGSTPELLVTLEPDVRPVVRRDLPPLRPSPARQMYMSLLDEAHRRVEAGPFEPLTDAGWLLALFEGLERDERHTDILELSRQLLAVDGSVRRRGRPRDMAALAARGLRAAEVLGDHDLAGYYVLLVGEGQYKRGDVDGAAETFRRGLTHDLKDGRRLQLLRALGQTAYRRGNYGAALEIYEEAGALREEADPKHVATLDRQLAKTLFRLGEHGRALELLRNEAETRTRLGDHMNELRARHELARLQAERGARDEAEQQLRAVLALARGRGYRRFIAPPAYELCLLLLQRDEILEAERLQQEAAENAAQMRDDMGMTLAQLASALITLRAGELAGGLTELEQACERARLRGYGQLLDDAQRFLLDVIVPLRDEAASEQIKALGLLPSAHALSGHKRQKALEYAEQRDRLREVDITFISASADRRLRWSAGSWSCSCDLFSKLRTCTHVVAVELMTKLRTGAHDGL